MERCSHYMPSDSPKELMELMVGFFDGSITGRFELKPEKEMAFLQK